MSGLSVLFILIVIYCLNLFLQAAGIDGVTTRQREESLYLALYHEINSMFFFSKKITAPYPSKIKNAIRKLVGGRE